MIRICESRTMPIAAISVAKIMKVANANVSCDSSYARWMTSTQTIASASAPGAARSASKPACEIHERTGSSWIEPWVWMPVALRRSTTWFAVSRGTSASTRSPGGRTDAPVSTASALTVGSSRSTAVTDSVIAVGE